MSARIKICGITSKQDAQVATEAGADAIGLVFYPRSSRAVGLAIARDIALAVGPFVTVVGLFVNAEVGAVDEVLRSVPLHMLQFHGDEKPDYCQQFQRPFLKAIRVKAEDSVDSVRDSIARFTGASGILLDTYSKSAAGGTGETFNWECVPRDNSSAIVLAGGLTPDNVGEAVQKTQPYAVDVSTGVEGRAGVKDIDKIRAFIRAVRGLD